jgi:hypothetical protein
MVVNVKSVTSIGREVDGSLDGNFRKPTEVSNFYLKINFCGLNYGRWKLEIFN